MGSNIITYSGGDIEYVFQNIWWSRRVCFQNIGKDVVESKHLKRDGVGHLLFNPKSVWALFFSLKITRKYELRDVEV